MIIIRRILIFIQPRVLIYLLVVDFFSVVFFLLSSFYLVALISKEQKTSIYIYMYQHLHTFDKKNISKTTTKKQQFCLLKIGKIIRSIKNKNKERF